MSAPINITRWKTSVSKLSKSQLITNSNSRISKFGMHSKEMGLKNHNHKLSSSSHSFSIKPSTILTPMLFLASLIYFLGPTRSYWAGSFLPGPFSGDLRDAQFPWNALCFGTAPEPLKLAVFSKSWPTAAAAPGGMERHAATLYRALAARGHQVHVFTAPSDRAARRAADLNEGSLHVHFAANDHGSVNLSLAFERFNVENEGGAFDCVHSESVSLPHWRAKDVAEVAVTWHGIWYENMHSKLFQELLWGSEGSHQVGGLEEAMPRLVDEIKFFKSYKQHICISKSAGEVLVNIYQLPQRNVHVILNGVDDTKFVPDPESGARFRRKHNVPTNMSLVMGVAGRLVRDKGHPLLYEAFSTVAQRHPGILLLIAGSGPWSRRYAELGPNVMVLGPLEPNELSGFYNAIDVFVNPTLRPQGLDLTLIEAMHCGKPVLAPNFPSITGTVVLNEGFGYTFSPNVKSLVEAMESAVGDGPRGLQRKGKACKEHAASMFTASKMASAYERFFLCMKNAGYCHYPLPTDC
ncbi:Phosphatidylinositol N-acetylglucosaminyltransferase subunit A like [Actinidia chinensis var. chinensis]|uniref:Phosphatidylinositol N-acetylglucosaminyltransferase subunit A like n=1 Tax=Actinidia chinensis var. chinensis TaxID=1590841 RepID=A0A2R6QCJ9_ACTCC|nr:Phosphatidylinositol N-acetylglucosaminyltransferase subunit A like [Actinidia chinensis var. chinensis]